MNVAQLSERTAFDTRDTCHPSLASKVLSWFARRPLAWLTVALIVWGLTDVRSRGSSDPAHHRTDLTVYTEAGAAIFDGRDAYSTTNIRGWGYLYPPLLAIVLSPLHALDPQLQVVVWFLLSLLVVWGCWRESVRLVGLVTDGVELPRWIMAAAITTAALPTLNCLQRGQVGILKLYLLLVGLRLLLESASWSKPLLAGIAFALAIALKVTPILPIGMVLVERLVAALRHRESIVARQKVWGCWLGTGIGLVMWLLLVPSLFIGWQLNMQSLERWWNLVGTKAVDVGYDTFAGDSYSLRNQSLMNSVRHLGNWITYEMTGGRNDLEPVRAGDPPHVMDAPWVNRLLLWLRLTVLALAGLLAIDAGCRPDRLTTATCFGLGCVAVLVVSPISRMHYFMLVLPAVLFSSLWLIRAGRPQLARVMAWIPPALIVTNYCLLNVAGRAGLLGIGITAWLMTASLLILCLRRVTVDKPQILAFRTSELAMPEPKSLSVGRGTVGSGRLQPLVPDLVHHETDG